MAIYNFGSVNIDHVYQVDHFPEPGETLGAQSYEVGLGGKGANQSVSIARAGGDVFHIGAVGAGSDWALELLQSSNVSTEFIKPSKLPTGHAIINLDSAAENTIVIAHGANHDMDQEWLARALNGPSSSDWFLLQNETNICVEAVKIAKEKGMKIAYSAAPFDETALREILPHCDLLVVNEIEEAQARSAIPEFGQMMDNATLVVTKGARGAEIQSDGNIVTVPALKVEARDTTGAGDTFLGYFLAALHKDFDHVAATELAIKAAALQVTRIGAINAIPTIAEVHAFQEK